MHRLRKAGNAVLAHHHKAERRGKLIDAVPDFRIDMIRPAGKDHDAFPVLSCIADRTLPLAADIRHPFLIRRKAGSHSAPDVRRAEMSKPSLYHFQNLL